MAIPSLIPVRYSQPWGHKRLLWQVRWLLLWDIPKLGVTSYCYGDSYGYSCAAFPALEFPATPVVNTMAIPMSTLMGYFQCRSYHSFHNFHARIFGHKMSLLAFRVIFTWPPGSPCFVKTWLRDSCKIQRRAYTKYNHFSGQAR